MRHGRLGQIEPDGAGPRGAAVGILQPKVVHDKRVGMIGGVAEGDGFQIVGVLEDGFANGLGEGRAPKILPCERLSIADEGERCRGDVVVECKTEANGSPMPEGVVRCQLFSHSSIADLQFERCAVVGGCERGSVAKGVEKRTPSEGGSPDGGEAFVGAALGPDGAEGIDSEGVNGAGEGGVVVARRDDAEASAGFECVHEVGGGVIIPAADGVARPSHF